MCAPVTIKDSLSIGEQVAVALWKKNAVRTAAHDSFTWTSGIRSPIYCDSRVLISHAEVRQSITRAFEKLYEKMFAEVEVIAGVATGGILYGGLLADALGLPFIYVRPQAKSHGMGKAIEGQVKKGQKVVVVEDVCTTGGSIRQAVAHLQKAGLQVCGLLAVFSYGLKKLAKWLEEAQLTLHALTSFETLIQVGREEGRIQQKEYERLLRFHEKLDKTLSA